VINYRLNIFGFLSAEDSSLPGNYGSLDQVEALRFIINHLRRAQKVNLEMLPLY